MKRNELLLVRGELLFLLGAMEEVNNIIKEDINDLDKVKIRYVLSDMGANLQRLYNGIEENFMRISKMIDQVDISGPTFHKDLLDSMLIEIKGVRPVVISQESYDFLNNLRSFRHVFTHQYKTGIKWDKMKDVVLSIPGGIARLKEDLYVFIQYIDECTQE